jgi:hypothetical protein
MRRLVNDEPRANLAGLSLTPDRHFLHVRPTIFCMLHTSDEEAVLHKTRVQWTFDLASPLQVTVEEGKANGISIGNRLFR